MQSRFGKIDYGSRDHCRTRRGLEHLQITKYDSNILAAKAGLLPIDDVTDGCECDMFPMSTNSYSMPVIERTSLFPLVRANVAFWGVNAGVVHWKCVLFVHVALVNV